jgi:hypothetical protein
VINATGGPVVDPSNPFFQSLGTNGRSCGTRHEAQTTADHPGVRSVVVARSGLPPGDGWSPARRRLIRWARAAPTSWTAR